MKNMKLYIALILLFCAFQVFSQGILTLDQSIELALQNNTEIQNSALEIKAAKQVKKAAFTHYFPQIDAGGMMFEMDKNVIETSIDAVNLPVWDGNPATLMNPSQFAYFPGMDLALLKKGTVGFVNALQPVFAGGRIYNGNKLASVGVDATKYKHDLKKDEIVLKTEEQYWQIVSLDEKTKTIDKYLEMLNSLQDQVNDAYEAGIVMKNDVLKVKLELNKVLLQQSKLLNGKKLANMAFCQNLGISLDTTLVLRDELVVKDTPETFYVDKNSALVNRDEYQLLQLSVKAEKLQTRMSVGKHLPQAGVGINGLYVKVDEFDKQTNSMVYGTVAVPISGWWGGTHELQEHKVKENIAKNNLANTSELLLLQIQKAWQDFTDAYKQYQLSLEAKAQADENLKVNQDSYDNGLITVSDLLEAQALLQQTEDQLIDAKSQYLVNKTRYLQVTGR